MASIQVEEPIPEEELQANRTQQGSTQSTAKQKESSGLKQFVTDPGKRSMLLIVVLALAFGGYVIKSNNDKQALQQQLSSSQATQQQNPAAQQEGEAEALKKEVGQFLELPADETPTVATVVDAEKVRNQAFFVNAQNDDKVLLFSTSGKAILYRPSIKKIIEVAPIDLNNSESAEESATPEGTTTTAE